MHPRQVLSTSALQPQMSGSLWMRRKTSALIKPCVCTGFVHAPESITPFLTITNFQTMSLTMVISKIFSSSYFPFWTKELFLWQVPVLSWFNYRKLGWARQKI